MYKANLNLVGIKSEGYHCIGEKYAKNDHNIGFFEHLLLWPYAPKILDFCCPLKAVSNHAV